MKYFEQLFLDGTNEMVGYRNPSLKLVEKFAEFTKELLKEDDVNIDVILAVERGGVIPAAFVSRMIKVPFEKVAFSSTKGKGKEQNRELQEMQLPELSGSSILIIDDICDSGNTLKELVDFLNKGDDNTIITSVMYYKSEAIFKPNYCFFEILNKDAPWITFHWEKWDE